MDDLKRKNVTKLLAKHHVVTEAGKWGTSVQPVKTRKGGKASAITSIRALAIPLLDGFTHLEVNGEVSVSEPSFEMQSTRIAIRLRSGQTLCMGGLIRNRVSSVADQILLLGDLPLVGDFFRQRCSREAEEETLLIVTLR